MKKSNKAILIHEAVHNSRPLFSMYDEAEKIIEPVSRYSLHLNLNLRFSPLSLKSYVHDVGKFLMFLRCREGMRTLSLNEMLLRCTDFEVRQFLGELMASKLSDSTVRSNDVRLMYFFNWLYSFKSGYDLDFKKNPYADDKYKTPTPYRNSKKFLTYLEVAVFLQSFRSENDRSLGHFMYDTGARISEVCRVRLEDLPDPDAYPDDFVFYPILIRGSKGRGGIIKQRYSLISRVVLNRTWRYFNNWVKPNVETSRAKIRKSFVFLNNRLRPVKKKSVTDRYYQQSLELRKRGVFTKTITPHMFRHGAALSILSSDMGKDMLDKLLLLKKMFGHNQIRSTEVYTNIPLDAQLAIRALSKQVVIKDRTFEAQYIFDKTYSQLR